MDMAQLLFQKKQVDRMTREKKRETVSNSGWTKMEGLTGTKELKGGQD